MGVVGLTGRGAFEGFGIGGLATGGFGRGGLGAGGFATGLLVPAWGGWPGAGLGKGRGL